MPGERWTSRRPGLHLDQNVLGLLRRDSLGLDSGPLGWPLFRCRTARSAPVLLFGRKRGCAFYLFIRQPMGRKSALRREILWILRGFQGRLSC